MMMMMNFVRVLIEEHFYDDFVVVLLLFLPNVIRLILQEGGKTMNVFHLLE
jgi:hypothetical protein